MASVLADGLRLAVVALAPMIDRRQLAEALGRLDPRDREVLDYSLRRHVPDNDLAAVFGVGSGDVARMRAAAVERLANDLGAQRGTDLGQVLTALLEQETWELAPAAVERDTAPDDAGTGGAPVERADDQHPSEPSGDESPQGAAQGPDEPEAQAPRAVPSPPVQPAGTSDDSGDGAEASAGARQPVLDMLAEGDGGGRSPSRGARRSGASPGVGAGRRWLAAAAAIAVLVTVGLGSVLAFGGDAGPSASGGEASNTRPFVPREEEIGEPFPSDPASAYRYPIAILEEAAVLLDVPGGKPKVKIGPQTEWDSPRVLSVVERQGGWLSVLVPELPNGEVGWIEEEDVARLETVGWAVRADLARRVVEVERDGEVVRRFQVGVGRVDHPTPPGRYAVTDKLRVTDSASPYGCCVVALTGHQTELPAGWPGGDRLAIHATADTSGLGEAVSLGCLRVAPKDARWLLDTLPLGTPVFIEAGDEAEPPRRSKPRERSTSRSKSAKRS
ncbi:MAG: L,D-transpeptidase family protein [Thermoleophilaceae bacterium]